MGVDDGETANGSGGGGQRERPEEQPASPSSATASSLLSLELFQQIINSEDSDVILESFQAAPGSCRGDNYTAALFRIKVEGYKPAADSTKRLKWQRSIICKRLPDNKAMRAAYRSEALFQ